MATTVRLLRLSASYTYIVYVFKNFFTDYYSQMMQIRHVK
jgi:hypothetical protein